MRWRRVAAAVGLGLVVATIVGVGHVAATLPAQVTVLEEHCTAGNVTALTLAVEYDGTQPVTVTPHVWSSKQHVQFPWQPESIQLEPGRQVVHITAPDPRAYIQSERGQVWLASGQQRSITNWEVTPCPSGDW